MPRGNRTGPNGMGPMTGRAAGFCAGNDEAGFYSAPGGGFGRGRNREAGRGFGNGFGAGRGGGFRRGSAYGRRFAPDLPTKAEVKEAMNAEVAALEQRIAWLGREIDALDAENLSEEA